MFLRALKNCVCQTSHSCVVGYLWVFSRQPVQEDRHFMARNAMEQMGINATVNKLFSLRNRNFRIHFLIRLIRIHNTLFFAITRFDWAIIIASILPSYFPTTFPSTYFLHRIFVVQLVQRQHSPLYCVVLWFTTPSSVCLIFYGVS
jgi:hypothetical protein